MSKFSEAMEQATLAKSAICILHTKAEGQHGSPRIAVATIPLERPEIQPRPRQFRDVALSRPSRTAPLELHQRTRRLFQQTRLPDGAIHVCLVGVTFVQRPECRIGCAPVPWNLAVHPINPSGHRARFSMRVTVQSRAFPDRADQCRAVVLANDACRNLFPRSYEKANRQF